MEIRAQRRPQAASTRAIWLLLLGLAGCSGGDEPAAAPTPVSPTPTPTPTPTTTPVATTGPVAFIGDSITANWPLGTYLLGPINAGIGGEETPQMLARFDADVLSRQPVAVVILGGYNDINHRGAVNTGNVLAMAQKGVAANLKVFVGTVLPAEGPKVGNPTIANELIDGLNRELVLGATTYGYRLVNFHDAMLEPDGTQNSELFRDGVHPNKSGYDVMWSVLRPALAQDGIVLSPDATPPAG